jgi:hypothetical protein
MSLPLTFKVEWKRCCYLCNNPLDVKIIIPKPSRTFIKRYYNFLVLRPNDMHYNASMLKVFNMKARRVCYWCFMNKPHKKFMNPRHLMNRTKPETIRSESYTQQQIFLWFESLYNYLNRPDADEYMVI